MPQATVRQGSKMIRSSDMAGCIYRASRLPFHIGLGVRRPGLRENISREAINAVPTPTS